MLLRENRDIKRHIDQIRDGESDVNGEDMLPLDLNESRNGEVEHAAVSRANESISAEDTSIITIDSSADNSVFEDAIENNISIPDIIERPPKRACVTETNRKMTEIAQGNRRN